MEGPLLQSLFELEERRPWTVSELNAQVRSSVEREFASVWVEGEVVDFKQYSSGHWYFNLNDGSAQLKCVCWKGTNFKIRFKPQNGITVRVRGRLTFWEQKGELKLTIDSLEPSGEGALRAAFEQIKASLEAEGLFAPELKRPLPFFPRKIGIVTSRSGAAYHDIVNVLTRRARSVSIIFAAAQVQGEGAADSIRRALAALNRFNNSLAETDRIDVLIVGRGGGSAEDLWAFNDERLARAIRASAIPVISAVGHEIDWTICDLICDLRAPTPSAAAEMVAACEADIFTTLRSHEDRMRNVVEYQMLEANSQLREAASNLESVFSASVRFARDRFANVSSRLTPANLKAKAEQTAKRLSLVTQRNETAMRRLLGSKNEHLNVEMAKLSALSPLAVLTRGYSITQTDDGRILRDASTVNPGDKLKIKLERGKLDAEVVRSE